MRFAKDPTLAIEAFELAGREHRQAGRDGLALHAETRANELRAVRRNMQTQSCQRGEHLYVTGRRSCPLCGEEL